MRLPLTLVAAAWAGAAAAGPPSQSWFDALNAPEIDDAKIGTIENVTLVRETASFRLISGVIHFFRPTTLRGQSRVTGGMFIGRGTFSHRPPTDVERRNLAFVTGADSVRADFEVLYLRFADGTYEELAPHVIWTGDRFNHPQLKKDFCEQFTTDWVAYALLQCMTLDAEPRFFYAHVGPSADLRKPWLYVIDPLATEEVWVAQRQPRDVGRECETLNRFRTAADYAQGLDADWQPRSPLTPEHYTIHCDIGDDGMLRVGTRLLARAVRGPLSCFDAELFPKLRVRGVLADSGRVSFEQRPDSGHVFVFLDPPLSPLEARTFEFQYSGLALEKDWYGYYVPGPVSWYPRVAERNDATFDLVFDAPTGYEVVAVGQRVTDGDTSATSNTTRWKVTTPTEFAAFNVGKFERFLKKPDADSLPVVMAYASLEGKKVKTQSTAHRGEDDTDEEILQADKGSRLKHGGAFVAAEVADAAKFFSWLFGRCPSPSLAATEVPASYGISFPGLIHLAGSTFYHESSEGQTEAFRSHEVAHQWWGNGVKPASYHDAWISEGFAEYSGYRYAGWARKDDKCVYSLLEKSRNDLIANQKAFLKDRIPAAPLWLGYRESSSRSEDAYWLTTYQKGAYVLHMLSSMLLDYRTMYDPEFVELMRDFFARYNGRRASTEDFRRCVEEHVGMDMGWFFDEWVYGTEIPTYHFGWGKSKLPDGGYQLQGTVRQSNVSSNFKMYATVRVDFADGQYAHFRVLVSKPEEKFTLRVPMEPQGVHFNDLNSVLAEVEER